MIGFASGDGGNGTGGIEQYYNDSLIGVNGREYGYLDEDANLGRCGKVCSKWTDRCIHQLT